MNKAKIEIETRIDNSSHLEKYICQFDEDTIVYTDKQKTKTTIKYDDFKINVKREGTVNYQIDHDGRTHAQSDFTANVEGRAFSMILNIENKYYKLSKYGKILSIEIRFLRDDNQMVEQIFKVEEK